mmetsp:Transcript_54308/g.172458  ORF Transcript_54308/g.172458 Transcript_54308/m.172458 type:complete len:255 (+) Transcript_54308:315-1079(+)
MLTFFCLDLPLRLIVIACFCTSGGAARLLRTEKSMLGPISASSTRGVRTPERLKSTWHWRSSSFPPAAVQMIRRSSPLRFTLSTTAPRKKSRSRLLSCRNSGALSNSSPMNTISGLLPSWGGLAGVGKSVMGRTASTPSSSRSYTWKSNMRPIVMLWGRFFWWLPSANSAQSDFCAKNSSDTSPPDSKGRTSSFFLLWIWQSRRPLSFTISPNAALSIAELLLPYKKSAFFVSSCSFGARFLRKRLPFGVFALA